MLSILWTPPVSLCVPAERSVTSGQPALGPPRIHGELLKLGITIAQSSVAKYMERRCRPPSRGWKTFLRNHAPQIAAVDLFVVPTIGFKLLYALVILRLERRLLLLVNVTAHPTAEWVAQQITEAFPLDQAPRYLIRDRDRDRDRDGVYGAVVKRRLRARGIRDRPIAPRSPWQNGYVERLIGSIRTHLVLGKDAPLGRPVLASGQIHAVPILGGLHHHYVRTAGL
jgi:transposase InsO family protein